MATHSHSTQFIVDATTTAYSFKRYSPGGWRTAIRGLLNRGFTIEQTIEIMASKIPRWAADQSSARYGRKPGRAVLEFVDAENLTPATLDEYWKV